MGMGVGMSDGAPVSGFVAAAGVRLHFLDWGGDGPPLVLLPGLGQSAHVFRDLAAALADRMRVLALTPRAHGESDAPEGRYRVAMLAGDARAFLDALGIESAALGAHSFSGAVATRLAADHPERVSRIVYLDAVTDYAGMGGVQARSPARPPHLSPKADADAERAWLARYYYGAWSDALEADFQARPPRADAAHRRELLSPVVDDAAGHPAPYARLRCPTLALVAAESVDTVFGWLDAGDERRERARDYLATVRDPWRRAEVERFCREAPNARVVYVPGHHFLFVSSRDAVAREMRAFLLPSDREHASR